MPPRTKVQTVHADVNGQAIVIIHFKRANGTIDKEYVHASHPKPFRSLVVLKEAIRNNALAPTSTSQQLSTCICKDEAQIEVDPEDDDPPARGCVWKQFKLKHRVFCAHPLCPGAECYSWKQCKQHRTRRA